MRGILGLRAQGMDGRKSNIPTLAQVIRQSHAGIGVNANVGGLTLAEDLLADIFATAAGGSGGSSPTDGRGGGGGAAGYSRLLLARGARIDWSIGVQGGSSNGAGTAGGDLVLTVDGQTMTAQGGRAGTAGTGVSAGRASATGFQVNRYGGGSGERGQFGVAPDSALAIDGGTSGGFSDLFGPYTSSFSSGAAGLGPVPVASIGGGGRGGDTGFVGYGGAPLLTIFLYRLTPT